MSPVRARECWAMADDPLVAEVERLRAENAALRAHA